MGGLQKLVGGAIRRHRMARGWNQGQLAAAIGRSVDLISRLERGDASPSLDTVELISGVLNVSPAQLLGGQAAYPQPEDEAAEALIRRVLNASPAERDWVAGLLDHLDRRPARVKR